jgi:hypothetical protein
MGIARSFVNVAQLAVALAEVFGEDSPRMTRGWRLILALALALGGIRGAQAQIDPTRRELVQIGYNQPLEGRGPLAAYAFYYLNRPDFLQSSNLTLRLAVAPVYMDSEVGIHGALGLNTDVGLGLAGGGFADSYSEVRQGKFEKGESFLGHSAETSASVYHLFNPASRIPLYGILRGAVHYSVYARDDNTKDTFELPEDQLFFKVRAGLRFGGREPVMMPELAMELSAWYEGEFRAFPNRYGFSDDRSVEAHTHRLWARALLNYTTTEWKHNFAMSVTGGSGVNLDRFSAYRMGGNLPLSAEFPLTLPGYYYQELSATGFTLFAGQYNLPLDPRQRFMVNVTAATAWVDYLDGLRQPGNWHSGVGGGFGFRSPSEQWLIAVGYGYGINAIRDGDRGAHSVLFLLQFDWGRTRQHLFNPDEGFSRTRGLDAILKNIFR